MDYLPWLWYQQLFLETPGPAIWGPGRGRGRRTRTASHGGLGAAAQPLGSPLPSCPPGPWPGDLTGRRKLGPRGLPLPVLCGGLWVSELGALMPPSRLNGAPGRPWRGSREGSPGPPVAPVKAPSHNEAPGLCPLLTADQWGGACPHGSPAQCPPPPATAPGPPGHAVLCPGPTPGSGLAAPASSPCPTPSSPQGTCMTCPAQHSWWGPGLGPTLRPTSCSFKNPWDGTPTHVCAHTRVLGPTCTRQLLRQPSRISSTGHARATAAPTCPWRAQAIGAGRGGCGRTGVDGPLVGGTEDRPPTAPRGSPCGGRWGPLRTLPRPS